MSGTLKAASYGAVREWFLNTFEEIKKFHDDHDKEVEKILKNDSVVVAVQKEIDAINKEIICLNQEIQQAKILLEYGAYIGKSCGYLVQAIQETNALSQAAKTALAKAENAAKNND